MAALGSQSIASSYEQLLHVDADGGGNTTNHVSVKDGDNGTTFGFTIASDALMMSSTNRLEFGDTGTYIHQSADGVLDLVSDTEIELNGTIDINGAVTMDGGNVTINDDSGDYDFRVESNGSANMLFVDGGNEEVLIQRAASGGTATAGSVLIVEDDDNAEISLLGGSSSVLAINFGHSGDVDDGMIQYNTTSGSENMAFTVNAAARMTVGLGGDVDVETGDIFFSTAGKGICLGVTSNTDSNTLDDYEEGVYTPTLTCTTAGGYTTGSYTQLSYTKVGRSVNVGGYLQIDSESGTPDGTMRLSLPFTASNLGTGADNVAGVFRLRDTGGSDSLLNTFLVIRPNEAASELLAIDADGTKFGIDEGDVDTAWSCWFGFTYNTAT